MFARGIARILFAEGIGELNRLQFMLQQGYDPCNLVLLQNLWFIVGADSISARATTRNHAMAGRSQDPSLRHYFIKECRGAHCAPVQFNGGARFRGRTLFAPTATTLKAPLEDGLPPVRGRWHEVPEGERSRRRRVKGGPRSTSITRPPLSHPRCQLPSRGAFNPPSHLFTNLLQFTLLTFTMVVLQY